MFSKIRLAVLTACLFLVVTPFSAATPVSPANPKSARSIELNEKGVAAMQSGDTKDAEELFRQAYASDRNNLSAALNLAGLYLANKKDKAAITLLEDLTSQVKDDPALFARLGDAYFSNRQPSQAAGAYEKSLALDSTQAGVSRRLGTVYSLLGKNEQAERQLEKAVDLEPKDSETIANLGAIYLANGKPSDAIRAAKRALQIKVSGDAYVTLGAAYEMLNDPNNALISYEKAASLGSKHSNLQKKIEQLKRSVS